ncbi:MAG: cupredoxin domain-containing protein [Armatimonadota bacterium]|nr:cupredoxin domain-containing protein [Armatimonadota bacterium]MDR7421158.1 cupredoxin domain-containing protein [Armatimonadota bacterium]MDR7453474.1 cupredoxin domain-containing protein [Armatimonadota bacterium]MDR7457255.1 cupredoxin domain-containing protein [Armatimonadota bacterium]MDR7496096.1 cupredoxin domain-containing protein [Armatimonadota bacterium]
MSRQTTWGIALIVAGMVGLAVLSALVGGDAWAPFASDGGPDAWEWRGPMGPGFGGPHMGPWMWRRGGLGGGQIPPVAGARTVEIVATDFAFQPAEVTVRAGEAVNIRLVNRGVTAHDLLVPALEVWIVAPPGRSATSGLRLDQPGTYAFFCSVPGHREAGMVGRLVVTP